MKERAVVEIAESDAGAAAPPPVAESPAEAPAARKRERDRDPERERESSTMRTIAQEEDRSLKDWLDVIGTRGAFKVQIHRDKPASIVVNGKSVDTKGYLETVEDVFDDDYLKKEWGGGTYTIKVTRKSVDGSFKYEKGFHRTIVIAGDPRADRLPGNAPPAAVAAAPPGENPSIAKMTLDMMREQMDRQVSALSPRGIDPTMQVLIDQFRRDGDASRAVIAALQAKVDSMSNQKPVGDPIKDELLGSLIKGETGRIEALRAQHESELRQLREGHAQEIRTLNERFDRERDYAQRQSERLLDSIKAGYEREISGLRLTSEVTTTSNKSAFDVQAHTLRADATRLERENTELRAELRELREKKDQSLADKVKEIKALEEMIGSGDDKGGSSIAEKIAETVMNPAALEQIGKIFRGPAAAPPVAAQVAMQAPPTRPQIVRDNRTGQRFAKIANPQAPGGVSLVPVKRIPQKVVKEDGSQVDLPEVEPSQVALLVQYLERAFAGGQDPVVVAQSGRSMVPDNIVTWIRENDGGAVSGVDLFMSKVAKLPGSSPLQSQRGRNWLRKVGKALAGDEPVPEPEPETEPEIPPPPAAT